MNRPAALVLVGILFLAAAAAIPFVGLAAAPWDTDYIYTVETDDSYCADVVHDSTDIEGATSYRIDYENLSTTGRHHFERALTDGQYTVENEADAAPDFQFTDDHVAAGEGCYAISYDGETRALRTSIESQRIGLAAGRWPSLIAGLLLVLGAATASAGVGLALKRRQE